MIKRIMLVDDHQIVRAGLRQIFAECTDIVVEAEAAEILKAVRVVLTGKKYVSPALAQQLAAAFTGDEHGAPHEKLSTREFEVFCKLAAGRSVSNIAEELFLSVKTVSTHRARILEKMNLKTNADLTYYAIKNELIQ